MAPRKSSPVRCHSLKYMLLVIYILVLLFALFNFNYRCRVTNIEPRTPANFSSSSLPLCSAKDLELVTVDIFSNPPMTELEESNRHVLKGGRWKPSECYPQQKVAIIIPYRDRWQPLKLLLKRIHPMMQHQKLDYQILVVNQTGTEKFNRGRLMNIGFVEALKLNNFDCFVFHDVDLLPEHDRNLYMCDDQARHLAAAIDEMRFHVMYYNYAGGVIALNRDSFVSVNGYSNDYWGWGKEDDDFSARTMGAGLYLTRPPNHIGRYKMVRHKKDYQAPHGYDLFLTWRSRWKTDGLNSINHDKYKLLEKKEERLYTALMVDIGTPPLTPPIDPNAPKESLLWFLSFFFP